MSKFLSTTSLSAIKKFVEDKISAIKVTVDSSLSSSSTNPVQNKVINTALNNKADKSSIPTSLKNPNALTFTGGVTGTYDGSAAKTVAIPTTLPANGGNADTVNNLTVETAVPANAKFTDTVYTLPDATASVKGGVKVGSNITISSGTISLTKDNVTGALGYTPPTTNTQYSDMTAATADKAGTHGLVPAPAAGKQTSFLRGDGTWVVPTNTDTHYTTGLKVGASATATANAAATNGNVYLNVLDNSTIRDSHKIVGSGATTVTSDANGVITISSTDNNTVYTHPNSGVTAGTYRSVTVNAQGHVTAGTNPTTLAGYGITDAKIANGVITLGGNTITPLTSHQSLSNYYNKTEVDNKVSAIPKFAIAVVTDLPTSSISTTTIYLKKTGSDTDNLYTEYIYVNSKWEQLGTQKLDLSGYLTKTDASNTYLGKTANAASATKATNDGEGNSIRGTYAKASISYSNANRQITITRGDNATFNATIPEASATVAGLVKVGTGLSMSSGVLNSNFDSSKYMLASDIANNYLGKNANAVAAGKLTTNAGSVTVPTYFKDGLPTACTGISLATVTATTTLNIPGGKIWIE